MCSSARNQLVVGGRISACIVVVENKTLNICRFQTAVMILRK
jgi:hypothetical protein